jgi:hypothetical protein
MLSTAKQHFEEDIVRARALVSHVRNLPAEPCHDDILRAAWMMAVGACDAYFSDAYADLISRVLRAKEIENKVKISDKLNNLKIPVIAILSKKSGGWRWRMAARELIEDENVLSLDKIRTLFNQFFRENHKILNENTIEKTIFHAQAKNKSRLFGITSAKFKSKHSKDKGKAKKDALKHFEKHFREIFQRRHDCIHNCDRPKVALQKISPTIVDKKIEDIEFLVERCHEAFMEEFSTHYLKGLGFSAVTRNRVCT